jgi:crotonobetainyl-CoA:carnitine CoA-transferase CaiB-like acyl-CoA transferase
MDQATTASRPAGPLAGVRVVEVSLMHAGPVATCMLGALGAELIKVEGISAGDPARTLERSYAQDGSFLPGRSVNFESYNSGKKSISLDLKHPDGIRLLYELVAKSDVFLHNMRQETAKKLGFDFDDLVKHNPKLVFATISGFGPYGIDSARPGLDPVGMARSGLLTAISGGSQRQPVLPPTAASDRMAGIMTAYGILAGLYARDHTGEPQRIDSSLLGGAMWLGQMNLQYALFKGEELVPAPREDTPLYTVYRCADQRWIAMWVNNERAWPAFCRALGVAHLLDDPRYATHRVKDEHCHELADILGEAFARKTSREWNDILKQSPDIVFSLVQVPTELHQDPQIMANGYIVEVEHPEAGLVRRVALPLHVNGAAVGGFLDPAPRLGEHSAEILSSILGLDEAAIGRLAAAGVTQTAPEGASA